MQMKDYHENHLKFIYKNIEKQQNEIKEDEIIDLERFALYSSKKIRKRRVCRKKKEKIIDSDIEDNTIIKLNIKKKEEKIEIPVTEADIEINDTLEEIRKMLYS